tara:strand:- start:133 stop:687 length:555 start_codon:yes stop_codon:yes gene_type:complete
MTLQEKYGLLVKREDVFKKSMPKKQRKRIETKFGVDMITIKNEVSSRRKRIDVLVQYFTNRPGMIEEKCSTPVEEAFKIMLHNDFWEVACNISEICGCECNDILIRAEYEDDEINIITGTHRDMDEELVPVIKKMLQYMLPSVLKNVATEHNNYIMNEMESMIDEETEKALKKMDWDRTVKGEA